MKLRKPQMIILSTAGLTALLIGAFIALDPQTFYSGYGIAIEGNADMLSELRASGTNLAVLGGVILLGVAKVSLRPVAVAASLIVFTAFAAGRTLSLLLDGWPSATVLIALAIELTIAALCAFAFVGKPPGPVGKQASCR